MFRSEEMDLLSVQPVFHRAGKDETVDTKFCGDKDKFVAFLKDWLDGWITRHVEIDYGPFAPNLLSDAGILSSFPVFAQEYVENFSTATLALNYSPLVYGQVCRVKTPEDKWHYPEVRNIISTIPNRQTEGISRGILGISDSLDFKLLVHLCSNSVLPTTQIGLGDLLGSLLSNLDEAKCIVATPGFLHDALVFSHTTNWFEPPRDLRDLVFGKVRGCPVHLVAAGNMSLQSIHAINDGMLWVVDPGITAKVAEPDRSVDPDWPTVEMGAAFYTDSIGYLTRQRTD